MPLSTTHRLALAAVLLAPAAANAQRVAPVEGAPVVIAAPGSAHRVAADFTVTRFPAGANPFTGLLESVAPVDSGFIGGTNFYGDLAKGTALDLPNGLTGALLTSVDVVFTYKKPNATEMFDLKIYAGTPSSGPTGAPLGSYAFPVSSINAGSTIPVTSLSTTRLTLSSALRVPATFFVVLDFRIDSEPGLLGITKTGTAPGRNSYVWEKWSDNSWHNLSDAWYSATGDFGTGTSGWEMNLAANLSTLTAAEGRIGADGFGLRLAGANPVSGPATFVYGLSQSADAHLSIYDVRGREVARLAAGVLPAGESTATYDTAALAAGVYVARLSAGSRTALQTFVVR